MKRGVTSVFFFSQLERKHSGVSADPQLPGVRGCGAPTARLRAQGSGHLGGRRRVRHSAGERAAVTLAGPRGTQTTRSRAVSVAGCVPLRERVGHVLWARSRWWCRCVRGHAPPSARGPGLCFPPASLGPLGWGRTARQGLEQLAGQGSGPRGAPDTEVGLGGVEGGRACRGPMRAQGVKASVAGQRARARRQSPGGRQEWPRQASLRTGSLVSGSVPAGRGAGFGSVLAARARGAGARSRPGKGGVGTFSRSPPRAGVGAPGSPEPLCSRTGRGEGLGPPA